LHPDLPFQYFLDLISGLKQRFPQVHLKAFTMVEVAYLSKRAKLSIRETLQELKAAGVDSLPGGGAEIFADRVRHIICDHNIDGTVIEEKIYHDAGATTPQGMRRQDLVRLIREAGREPVERDTLYRPVTRTETSVTVAV